MKNLIYLTFILLTFFSCRKDSEKELTTENNFEPPTLILEDYKAKVVNVRASVFGTVYNEAGELIEEATVVLGNLTETTDENGQFLFSKKGMNAEGTYIEVRKPGYFNGSTRFFPKENSQNYITIRLIPKSSAGNFNSTAGGNITGADGIQIDFPANAVVDNNGDSYTGEVEVFARWIDPTSEQLSELMPGNLQGIDRLNEDVALVTYGMMAIEIESPTGELLNLGNDQKATLSFPVPASLIANAPAEIPLWYFNENYGLWHQQGTAVLEGTYYVGEVSHFSFWNCDFPYPLITLSGRVISDAGNPMPNVFIRVKQVGTNNAGGGYTDNDGYFSGKVPANVDLETTILPGVGTCNFSTTIPGNYSEDTDLEDIIINFPDLVNITGSIVDCDGNPTNKAIYKLTFGNRNYTYYLEDENQFQLSIINCDQVDELTVQVIDLVNLEESDVMTFPVTSSSIVLGELNACGNTLDEFMIINIDGVETIIPDPFALFGGPDSSFISAYIPNSNTSVSIDFSTAIMGTGVYGDSDINYFYLSAPSNPPTFAYTCEDACGFSEITFTDFGPVGEKIIGTFSGEGDFVDSMQQAVTLPFSAEFEIYRE